MDTLRSRILSRETLVGTFIKTPSSHVVEILGQAGLDFAVIDQEHAPIGIADVDRLALAGAAAGLPLLIRRTPRREIYTTALPGSAKLSGLFRGRVDACA
ncbi:hypothetical protein [Amorphus sp. MBR-141]